MTIAEIFLLYVCPSMGGIMSTTMFAAPITDMRKCLAAGKLGDLNPFPFAMTTGNTLGWLIYGYFVTDPFLIASNLPGFIMSFWLNGGAAKLQYLAAMDAHKAASVVDRHQLAERFDADRAATEEGEDNDILRRRRQQQQQEPEDTAALLEETSYSAANSDDTEYMIMTPQEALLLKVLIGWSIILIYTTWLYPHDRDTLVGILVNIQLVAFYAAPLKTMGKVIAEKNSASIHYETMVMNWINTSFWIGYGCARRDPVIAIPNATGLALGLAQGLLCLLYPRQPGASSSDAVFSRLSLQDLESDLVQNEQHHDEDDDEPQNPEVTVPSATASTAAKSSSAVGGEENKQYSAPELV